MSPVRFHLPTKCFHCDGVNTVALQTIVRGSTVALAWVCQACGRETPINIGNTMPAERRTGPRDRRRVTRRDRRKR